MLVTIAILLLVYYGMRKETYERTTAYAQMAEKDDELIGKWCGCIMMVCAAAYQLIWNIWNVSLIVFPIGGILCGIVSIILSKEEHSR